MNQRFCIRVVTRHGTEFYLGPQAMTHFPEVFNSWDSKDFAEFKMSEIESTHCVDIMEGTYTLNLHEFAAVPPPFFTL